MIVIMKKNNIILVGLIFLLLVTIYSLNAGADNTITTTGDGQPQVRTVIIDPGHGGEDPGKVGNNLGLKEKDVNLKIAQKLKALLEKDNFKVLMTREDDLLRYEDGTTNIIQKRKQDLLTRKKLMDEGGANIVVSIHHNSFEQPKYFGAQTFYPPNSPESQKLANSIQKALREKLDPNNQRQPQLKKEQIIILRDLKTPTTIVECGFLSNAEEERKLGDEAYQEQLAAAIVEGIKSYFR